MSIHNDSVSMLDSKLNVVNLVFDLSAVFYTVNLNILLGKLGCQYDLTDIVFAWFESYLSSRKYYQYVKVNNSSLHDISILSGVRQRSLLGPCYLVCMCTSRNVARVAQLHNFKIHIYADDIQCYFSIWIRW